MALSTAANSLVVTTVLPLPSPWTLHTPLPPSVSCPWDTGMDQPSMWAMGGITMALVFLLKHRSVGGYRKVTQKMTAII